MATRQEIADAVATLLAEALVELGVDSAAAPEHVDVTEAQSEPQLPGYAIEIFESDLTRGIGSPLEVAESDSDGTTVDVVKRRRREASIDIMAYAGEGNQRTVNQLYDSADDAFAMIADTPESLHEDVQEIDIGGTENVASPSDDVRGDRYRVQLEYDRFYTEEFTPLSSVHIDLSVEESTTDAASDDGDTIETSTSFNISTE